MTVWTVLHFLTQDAEETVTALDSEPPTVVHGGWKIKWINLSTITRQKNTQTDNIPRFDSQEVPKMLPQAVYFWLQETSILLPAFAVSCVFDLAVYPVSISDINCIILYGKKKTLLSGTFCFVFSTTVNKVFLFTACTVLFVLYVQMFLSGVVLDIIVTCPSEHLL